MQTITNDELPGMKLVVRLEDGHKEFVLRYGYKAIRKAEEALGIDLKDFRKWNLVTSVMTPQLVLCGLMAYPDVTLEWLESVLNPAIQPQIQDAIFELLFPGVLARAAKLDTSPKVEAEPNAAA